MVSLIFQSLRGLSDLAPTANAVALDLVAGLHGADPSAHLDKSPTYSIIFSYIYDLSIMVGMVSSWELLIAAYLWLA